MNVFYSFWKEGTKNLNVKTLSDVVGRILRNVAEISPKGGRFASHDVHLTSTYIIPPLH